MSITRYLQIKAFAFLPLSTFQQHSGELVFVLILRIGAGKPTLVNHLLLIKLQNTGSML
jgi:hypothetical protein